VRMGNAAFFAPATRTSPASGVPPWIESFCIFLSVGALRGRGRLQRASHSSGE
jgi:hypothetical protein